ncbi:MAG: hypothetical protein ACRENL_05240 [Candidatus Dormibacteria bacterium]
MAVALASPDRAEWWAEKLMYAADGWAAEVQRGGGEVECPLHPDRVERRPTICPVCALVVCRERLRAAR